MKKKLSLVTLTVAFMCLLFSFTAFADTGPKPSVRISFEGLSDEVCYATLLSLRDSSGPARHWNGKEAPDYYVSDGGGEEELDTLAEYKSIWTKMVEYKDPDNYYFLQRIWKLDETRELAWTYYPPDSFKILLYYPESDTFVVSGIYERYAFDSYYTVNALNLEAETDLITAEKSYDYKWETISLVARILITILIETAVAFLFAYKGKREFMIIFAVNVVTQILLNTALNIENYKEGYMAFTAYYIFFEIIIFASEGLIYSFAIKEKSKKRNILYSLTSNAISFGAGLLLAHIIPGIF